MIESKGRIGLLKVLFIILNILEKVGIGEGDI